MSSEIIDEEMESMRNDIYLESGLPSKRKVVIAHSDRISTVIWSGIYFLTASFLEGAGLVINFQGEGRESRKRTRTDAHDFFSFLTGEDVDSRSVSELEFPRNHNHRATDEIECYQLLVASTADNDGTIFRKLDS